jgi:hypothetical protein
MATTKDQKDQNDAEGRPEQSTPEKVSIKEKTSKPRHRASVACASCRDRRIRVGLLKLRINAPCLLSCSVLCLQGTQNVRNANDQEWSVLLKTMMSGEGMALDTPKLV